MNQKGGSGARQNHTNKLEALLDAAVDAIITIDARASIQSINRAAETLFGYGQDELEGRNVKCLMPEVWAREHDHYIARYHKTGERHIIGIGREVEGKRKDGSIFPMHLSVSEYTVDGVQFFTGIVHDLTRRKEVETALVNAQKLEAVGQLTGGIAHDFNNLLTVITGNLELLLMQDGSAVDQELVGEALEAAQMGADLTGRLLAFARRSILSPRILDPNSLIANMSGMLTRTLRGDIMVESRLQGDVWQVSADPGQVENAVLNLAVNARDAMPEGGRLVIETSNVSVEDEFFTTETGVASGEYVRISLADSGRGMDAATLAKAFDPFFTTKEVGKGTGLGLSMVLGFARQSGGYATIYSEEDVGTIVNLYLPRAAADTAEDVPAMARLPEDLLRGDGQAVLVVEDDPKVRKLSVKRLQELGYVVIEAEDGASALKVLASPVAVDVVFTDVVMPGRLSGYQLASEVARIRPGLPVLLTSGYAEELFEHSGGPKDAPRLLRKPYKLSDLARMMAEVLRSDT